MLFVEILHRAHVQYRHIGVQFVYDSAHGGCNTSWRLCRGASIEHARGLRIRGLAGLGEVLSVRLWERG